MCIHICSCSFSNKLTRTLIVNQFTLFDISSSLAVKLRKINSSDVFVLRYWLHSQLSSSFKNEYVSLKKTKFRQSIWPARSTQPLRLRFLKALNTSSWKDFWSKGDNSQFENFPSFQISWTWSDDFRINENFIHKLSAMFTCREGKGGKVSSQASKMLYSTR